MHSVFEYSDLYVENVLYQKKEITCTWTISSSFTAYQESNVSMGLKCHSVPVVHAMRVPVDSTNLCCPFGKLRRDVSSYRRLRPSIEHHGAKVTERPQENFRASYLIPSVVNQEAEANPEISTSTGSTIERAF